MKLYCTFSICFWIRYSWLCPFILHIICFTISSSFSNDFCYTPFPQVNSVLLFFLICSFNIWSRKFLYSRNPGSKRSLPLLELRIILFVDFMIVSFSLCLCSVLWIIILSLLTVCFFSYVKCTSFFRFVLWSGYLPLFCRWIYENNDSIFINLLRSSQPLLSCISFVEVVRTYPTFSLLCISAYVTHDHIKEITC